MTPGTFLLLALVDASGHRRRRLPWRLVVSTVLGAFVCWGVIGGLALLVWRWL